MMQIKPVLMEVPDQIQENHHKHRVFILISSDLDQTIHLIQAIQKKEMAILIIIKLYMKR